MRLPESQHKDQKVIVKQREIGNSSEIGITIEFKCSESMRTYRRDDSKTTSARVDNRNWARFGETRVEER